MWREPKDAGAQRPGRDAGADARRRAAPRARSSRACRAPTARSTCRPSSSSATRAARCRRASRTIPIWPSSRVVGPAHVGLRRRSASRSSVRGRRARPRRPAAAARRRRGRRLRAPLATPRASAWSAASTPTRTSRRCAARPVLLRTAPTRSGRFRCDGAAAARAASSCSSRAARDWSGREAVTQTSRSTSRAPTTTGSRRATATAWTSSPRSRATSPATPRASRCACRSARRRRWSSVEREGVAETFVTQLSGSDPGRRGARRSAAIAPNVYVSVLAVRGREAEPAPTGVVDLAQARLPARHRRDPRRAGATSELAVRVEPEQPSYRVRETARVRDRGAHARRRARRRPAPRSRSPRSTRACSSCCRTRAGSCSTR